jgi:hypothetical protein
MATHARANVSGITVPLRGGNGRVLREGDEVALSDLKASYREQLEKGSDRLKELFTLQDGPSNDDRFDPTDHKVDEVLAYLGDADADEVERVLDLESKNKPNPRKTIMEYQPASDPSDDDEDDDGEDNSGGDGGE